MAGSSRVPARRYSIPRRFPCSYVPRHCRRRRPQLPIAISLSSFRSVSYSGDRGANFAFGLSRRNHGAIGLQGTVCGLRNWWTFEKILHVRRVKQGTPATHPLTGRELRALRRLQREQGSKSPFIFVSERGAPFSKRGFQALVERAARTAG